MAKFMPAEDGYLIVQLPNERVRAQIRRVVTDDAVIVEITSIPLAKTHNHQRGDLVGCRRKETAFGEVWEAVAEQKISIDRLAEQVAPKKPKMVKKKKPVRKGKKK